MPEEREPGYYRDPRNGDLWHLSENGWSWVNGGRFRFVPEGLERVGDPNPFRAAPERGSSGAES